MTAANDIAMPLLSQLTSLPFQPPAADANWITGVGGVRLYVSVRVPAIEPVGVIDFVLGPEIGSAELYPRFAHAARVAGFVTAASHPRGTGQSEGVRGDIDDYALFLADLEQGLAWLRQRFTAKPIFLFGHSAGAALALALEVVARTPHVAGLVLVNPAYKLSSSEGMRPSVTDYVRYGVNCVFRRSTLTVDMNRAPSQVREAADRAEAEAMQRDPLVVRHFSLRYLLAQRRVMDRSVTNAKATDAPLLLIQGARDWVVDPTGNDALLAAARTTDKVKVIAADGAHGSTAVETMVDPDLAAGARVSRSATSRLIVRGGEALGERSDDENRSVGLSCRVSDDRRLPYGNDAGGTLGSSDHGRSLGRRVAPARAGPVGGLGGTDTADGQCRRSQSRASGVAISRVVHICGAGLHGAFHRNACGDAERGRAPAVAAGDPRHGAWRSRDPAEPVMLRTGTGTTDGRLSAYREAASLPTG